MKVYAIVALAATCLTVPAFGQSATAISGAGAQSASQSGAIAVNHGNGNSRSSSRATGGNSTINIAGAPAQTVSTIRTEGKTSVETVPNAYAPGLAAAGIETCLGSISGGGSWLGTGISLGGTLPDPDCAARLDARTLWAMGPVELKKAAIARLCMRPDIYRSMPAVCDRYLPVPVGAVPVAAPVQSWKQAWLSTAPILLIDGATGKERMCNQYDEPNQKCVTWAYAAPVEAKPVKKKVAKPIPAPLPLPLPKVITEGPIVPVPPL